MLVAARRCPIITRTFGCDSGAYMGGAFCRERARCDGQRDYRDGCLFQHAASGGRQCPLLENCGGSSHGDVGLETSALPLDRRPGERL